MMLQNVMRGFLDALYPPLCLICGEVSRGTFPHCCETCYDSFEPVGRSCCELCGEPFVDSPVTHLCLPCMKKRPPFSWCRGLFQYRGAVSEALLIFKYGGRISLKKPLTNALAAGIETMEYFPEAELLVPVPLSWRGRWKRGFNQSHVLALPLARQMGIEICTDAIKKKGNRIQVGLTAAERIINASVSYVPGPSVECVKGKKVLLFDDVYTTGATVKACARILGRAGADVSVLTFARAGSPYAMGR